MFKQKIRDDAAAREAACDAREAREAAAAAAAAAKDD